MQFLLQILHVLWFSGITVCQLMIIPLRSPSRPPRPPQGESGCPHQLACNLRRPRKAVLRNNVSTIHAHARWAGGGGGGGGKSSVFDHRDHGGLRQPLIISIPYLSISASAAARRELAGARTNEQATLRRPRLRLRVTVAGAPSGYI